MADINNTLGATGGVQSVTGPYVDNTDPLNPIVNNPIYDNNGFLGQSYVVWTGVGFIYDVFYSDYIINEIQYPGGVTQITLQPSDPTFPRIDVVGVDALGVIVKTGIPGADPVQPTVNPETELEITPIIVLPGTTVPEIDLSLIYNENIEWTTNSNNLSVNFDSILVPFTGTKHVDAPAMTISQFLSFSILDPIVITDYTFLRFYINLKNTWTTNNSFDVIFYNNGNPVSSAVNVKGGVFNLVRTLVNTYQTIAIPTSNFSFTNANFNEIRFIIRNSLAAGFRLDFVQLLGGDNTVNPLQNAFTTVLAQDNSSINAISPESSFKISGTGGIETYTLGRTLFVDGSNIISNIPWTEITTDQVLALDNKYLTNNATKLILTLPTDNNIKSVKIASKLGGWKLLIPNTWEVLIANEIVTQDLESTLVSDSIELLSLGNNKYSVTELKGNIIFNNL